MDSSDAPEEWRPVPSLPPYAVSSLGNVRGHRKQLKPYLDACGYPRISTGGRSHGVHRLVAEAFLGPCPSGFEVAHKDHNRANAAASNLEYLTHADNVRASAEAGRSMRGEAHVSASMTEDTARAILSRHKPGRGRGRGVFQPGSAKALAREYGVSVRAVACLVRGETWKHLPRTGASPENTDSQPQEGGREG